MKYILVVEDDPKTSKICVCVLEGMGFSKECIFVGDSLAEAQEIYEERKEHWHFLLLDYTLPDGAGEIFLRRVQEDGFEIPTLLMSVACNVWERCFRGESYLRIMPKPFLIRDFEEHVKACLSSGGQKAPSATPLQPSVVSLPSLNFP